MDLVTRFCAGSPDCLGSFIVAIGTVAAAFIVGVAGGLISWWHSRERDRQDKEAQWRTHAIELTKLELKRKLKSLEHGKIASLRPSILDFLANYRDLQELDTLSPKELYQKIKKQRITDVSEVETPPGTPGA